MSMSLQHNALAANWDPEILAAYMAGVQKGEDSDEAMSSGDSDSEGEFEEDTSLSSISTAMSDIDIPHPHDIASDDSAFSSEDEFAEESIIERQTTRRKVRNDSTATCLVLTMIPACSRASYARDYGNARSRAQVAASWIHETAGRCR